MRDLEIRGAGNLLGAQQSGHITAVGFDLYCQLLKQSVASLKGEKVKPRVEVQVRLDFLALNAAEEGRKTESSVEGRASRAKPADSLVINIPRETATYSEADDDESPSPSGRGAGVRDRLVLSILTPLIFPASPPTSRSRISTIHVSASSCTGASPSSTTSPPSKNSAPK